LGSRRYIKLERIETIAIQKYRSSGHGITFQDLRKEFSINKKSSAQRMLKFFHAKNILFTANDLISERIGLLANTNPQQYFPRSIKEEIVQNLSKRKNVLVNPTGVRYYSSSLFSFSKGPLSNCLEPTIYDYLDYVVLPLLQTVPPDIHNIHCKTRISPACYTEKNIQNLPNVLGNRGKQLSEIIGKSSVLYTFYPSGSMIVQVKCSNNPFKLESETDHGRILAFIGQIRDRLIIFLNDRHERIVPDIMEWYLTECDINRDIKTSNWMQFTGINIQVRHLDHLFRIYLKSMGRNTVRRIEEERRFHNKPFLEALNDAFNPNEKTERLLYEVLDKLKELRNRGGRGQV
jgi:hypothetical protein